ncbi:hypothetical protein [Pseudomonas fontis]|uniref:Secreted protein n=1 Tax=Pseudomonas fontis TaxID=2942633 RepID=A0ABT5NLG2_9PSED|nr:hypothetical protein [Pseudomonas fontis]MDD0974934.1 hypothetical protein [Pseudomonas fontis]MDD0989375.1 hypothetical protein [Pseudomonas fontis]
MTRLALCLLLLATGASASPLPWGVNTFHDDERAATCWYTATGLSCIPDSQLKGRYKHQAGNERQLSPHETQPEPTPALAPGRWIDERYQL